MTQGFYERIGVSNDAPSTDIKHAYRRSVAHIMRRREATLHAGGDTEQLDLSRAQLDEAWNVLSNPTRRRQYDAMLAVARDGATDADVDDLWQQVCGAMIPPALAAAGRLVDEVTSLGIGPIPEPPSPEDTQIMFSEEVTLSERVSTDWGAPRVATTTPPPVETPPAPAPAPPAPKPAPPPPPAPAVVVPIQQARPATPDLRVVDAQATDAPVVDLWPTTPPRTPAPPPPTVRAAPPVPEPAPPPPAAPEPDSVEVLTPTSSSEFDNLIGQLGPSGALLRAVREQRGLSVQDLSDTTRISKHYIQALEDEAFDILPSTPTFVSGYVRGIARQLELDVDRVVEGYMRRFRGDG